MTTASLEHREHEPYPSEPGEHRRWCRTCTQHYRVMIVYPCGHATFENRVTKNDVAQGKEPTT